VDIDDDSGWLRIEPINPFAPALNDEGEEVGYRRVHFETVPSLARFILNLPNYDRNEQKQKEMIARAERELELLDYQETELT